MGQSITVADACRPNHATNVFHILRSAPHTCILPQSVYPDNYPSRFGVFQAALRLVGTVIDALRGSSNASSDYRDLINKLLHLETALIQIKHVELDASQNAEKVALRQAAAQCQRTIEEFWKRLQEYQPHLRDEGSGSGVKDGWKKIKWAVCQKVDLEKFRASLRGHASSIEILLATV